eukprot:m51a1_g12462 hypothetical protein (230) ;mRNA; f:178-2443
MPRSHPAPPGTIVGDLGKLESWCPSGSKLSVMASQSLYAGPGASEVSVVRAQRGATVHSCMGDATVCYHFAVPEGVALETPVLMVRSEILVQSDEADEPDHPHKTSRIVTAQTLVLVIDGRTAGSRDQRAVSRGDQKERVEEQAVQVERRGLAADAAIAAVFALACVGAIAAVVVAIRKRERKVNAAAARRDTRRRPNRRDLEMKRDSPRVCLLAVPQLDPPCDPPGPR